MAAETVDKPARYLAAHGGAVFEQIAVDEGPGAGRQVEICQYPSAQ